MVVGSSRQNNTRKQKDAHSALQNTRQHNQNIRENGTKLSKLKLGGQYKNYIEKGEVYEPSYEALKGSIARFRRETEAIKREAKQATELYQKI